MNRKEKMLQGLDLRHMTGIEVGPLDKSLVKKSEGTIFYVDHCDTAELKRRWSADHRINLELLHVDAVWGDNTLNAAVASAADGSGKTWAGADYLLASHVVEHVPDLVAWLQEIHDALRPSGLVRLAIPDKRYTFDYLRETTTLADVLTEHLRKRRKPSASRILDFALNAAEVNCAEAWRGTLDVSLLKRMYSDEGAYAIATDAEHHDTYHDVHCWSFTPGSFASLMKELSSMGLLSMECEWIIPTQMDDLEFFVGMRRNTSLVECCDSWTRARFSLEQSMDANST